MIDRAGRSYTVYMLFADGGGVEGQEQALYIGSTVQGYYRLAQHMATVPWWSEVAYAHFEHYDDRQTALARQRELIEELAPLHNKRFVPPKTARLNVVPLPDAAA